MSSPTPPPSSDRGETLERGSRLRLVLSTAPPDQATSIARALVDEGLAVCVNVVPGLRSIYRWRDAVADDPETLLVAKAQADGLEALSRRLRALHPYEVPEIVVLEPEAVDAAYARWALAPDA